MSKKIIYFFLVVVAFYVTTTFLSNDVYARYVVLHDYEDTITFVGDLYPRESTTIKAYKREGGIDNVVQSFYQDVLKESDYVVGNLECCISTRSEAYDKKFTFRVEPEYRNIFKDANIDLVTLANNHSMDFGEEALKDTMKNLDDIGISYIGVGNNIKEANMPKEKVIKGRKYYIYNATAVSPTHNWFATENSFGISNGYYVDNICKDIIKRKKENKNCVAIVYMHWGKEKEIVCNTYQRDLAISLIESGADLVVGSHPHVLQNIEYYKGVPIVYSLGNFIYGETDTKTYALNAIFDYSNEEKIKVYLKIYPGVSGYEKVVMYGPDDVRLLKTIEFLSTSPQVMINDEGYVVEYTLEDNK